MKKTNIKALSKDEWKINKKLILRKEKIYVLKKQNSRILYSVLTTFILTYE